MRVSPLPRHTFGAVVHDLSVSEALRSSDATIHKLILEAFELHGLLIFPDQHGLTPQEELQFAKWFPHDSDAPIAERAGPYASEFRRWKLPALPEVCSS